MQILGVLLDSPLHIWIVPQTALGSGLVATIKLTHSARSSVETTVRSSRSYSQLCIDLVCRPVITV